MKNISYAIDKNTGAVISRIGDKVAVPVLQYDKMCPENNFQTEYKLEKMDVLSFACVWDLLKWTKKIPIRIKNQHRKFWGMKILKVNCQSDKIQR